ncbi:hypothetical protein GCM10009678_28870 [Actinomadura kijaniata]|uniref:Uncharacterized protein n=1 Tax=Actinomadura namibiensis TaxID=182080 RepID=A0A7W3LJX2_ACTNM|nr:hypothetical protein [Actinomadura namibiensis]MBA8949490.1 hypothetical protein [Actinomadura namibiensis]
MKTLHKLAIVGFATAGLAMTAPAAMAGDTYHSQGTKAAGPGGATSAAVVSRAVDGKHKGKHHKDDGVFYSKKVKTAGPYGATSSGVTSAAD